MQGWVLIFIYPSWNPGQKCVPFSREHTFLPNVGPVLCQERWANCHFWLAAITPQTLATLRPEGMVLSAVSPFPHRFYKMQCFLGIWVSPQGRLRLLLECVVTLGQLWEGHPSVPAHCRRSEHTAKLSVSAPAPCSLNAFFFFYPRLFVGT